MISRADIKEIENDYLNKFIRFKYNGISMYGMIVKIDVLGWQIRPILNKLNTKSNIFISHNKDIVFEFVSIEVIIKEYEFKLGKDATNLSLFNEEELVTKLQELEKEYIESEIFVKDKIRIEECGIDTRLLHSLSRCGLEYIDDIAKLTEKEFNNIYGIGKNSIDSIKEILRLNELKFRDS